MIHNKIILDFSTFGDTLTDLDKENLFYFKKSISEKIWYKKTTNGNWERTFSFEVNFPSSFDIYRNDGSLIDFTSL